MSPASCDSELIDAALGLWPELFGFAYALTNDRACAEDHCQDAIVRLACADRTFDRSSSLLPLLFRTLRNLVIDEARQPVFESLDGSGEAEGPLPIEASEASDPSREALRRERVRRVRSVLDRLPAKWRAILYLRDGLDRSYREIAEIEGCTEDVVRVTLHRARERFRDAMRHEASEGTER